MAENFGIKFWVIAISFILTMEYGRAEYKSFEEELGLKPYHKPTYSPDGTMLASVEYGVVKVWAVKEKKLLKKFTIKGRSMVVEFSPDNKRLAAVDMVGNLEYESTIKVWDIRSGIETKVHKFLGAITSLHFSPDGNKFVGTTQLGPLGGLMNHDKDKSWWGGAVFVVQSKNGIKDIEIRYLIPELEKIYEGLKTGSPEKSGTTLMSEFGKHLIKIMPTEAKFSPSGKRIITKLKSNEVSVLDPITGNLLPHLIQDERMEIISALSVAAYSIPPRINSYTLNLPNNSEPIQIKKQTDGWWHFSTEETSQVLKYKTDEDTLVIRQGDLENRFSPAQWISTRQTKDKTNYLVLSYPSKIMRVAMDVGKKQITFSAPSNKTNKKGTMSITWE